MTSLLAFSSPWMLPVSALASALAALAYARALRLRRRLASLYPPWSRGWRRWWLLGNTARLAAVLLLSLAALGPGLVMEKRVPVEDAVLSATPATPRVLQVVMVDVSKSMRGGRIEDAVDIARAYMEALPPGSMVLVYGFAGQPIGPLCNGTAAACLAKLDALKEMAGRRYTAIGDAVLAAASAARAYGVPAVALVVTDGGNNYGAPPGQAIRAARAAGVEVVIAIVGDDPRAAKLVREAEAAGARLIYAPKGAAEAARLAVKRAALEATVEAAKNAGQAYVTLRTVSYLPTHVAAAAAAVLLAASRLADGA